jgi:hypothetical protein
LLCVVVVDGVQLTGTRGGYRPASTARVGRLWRAGSGQITAARPPPPSSRALLLLLYLRALSGCLGSGTQSPRSRSDSGRRQRRRQGLQRDWVSEGGHEQGANSAEREHECCCCCCADDQCTRACGDRADAGVCGRRGTSAAAGPADAYSESKTENRQWVSEM